MHIFKKLSLWCLLFSFGLPMPEIQAKLVIPGFVALLFPLPVAIYIAGYCHSRVDRAISSSDFKNIETSLFEEHRTMFTDVAGLDGVKEDMQDIIEYLKDGEKFRAMGAKMPRGILMQGAPGNGKTLLARALAGEANCSFMHVNGSDFNSEYMGKNSQKVQRLFASAREKAPSIIFIDEIDSIAAKRMPGRGSGGIEDNNNTLNTLLTEMDGFDQYEKPVVVIAATNRLDELDKAILRPGRFDRIVEVSKPLVKDRVQLLQIAFAKCSVSDDLDIDMIARATVGFSGAEVANLVNEAAILAVKDDAEAIGMEHVEMAYDNITLGRETKGMAQSEDDLWQTALHEAGHLIGYLFQDKTVAVHKVSITPRGKTLGVAHMLPLTESYSRTKDDMINRIVSCLAGREAELIFGYDLSTGASNDIEKAQQIAYDMVTLYGMSDDLRDISYSQFDTQLPNDIGTKVHNEVNKIIQKCRQITRALVADHKGDIEKIAKLLMKKGTVQGDEIYRLLKISQPRSISFS